MTGGAGYIGSHLVDRLVNEGCEVVVLDDLSSGRLENINHHVESKRVDFVRGDVCSFKQVKEAMQGVDAICHLAALVSIPYSMQNPTVAFDVNSAGTSNLLRACLKSGVEKFVFASTCAVYGEAAYLPIDEAHPTNPVSPYAASKLAAEQYCIRFYKVYGLKTVILRLFNVYGPRQGVDIYSGVITRFIKRLHTGEPPIIHGSGKQTRDFVHVYDTVEGVLGGLCHDNGVGQVFNIGSEKPTSINHLAKLLISIMNLKVRPMYVKPRYGDILQSYASIKKAKEILGYRPMISLEEGLMSLIDWMENNGEFFEARLRNL